MAKANGRRRPARSVPERSQLGYVAAVFYGTLKGCSRQPSPNEANSPQRGRSPVRSQSGLPTRVSPNGADPCQSRERRGPPTMIPEGGAHSGTKARRDPTDMRVGHPSRRCRPAAASGLSRSWVVLRAFPRPEPRKAVRLCEPDGDGHAVSDVHDIRVGSHRGRRSFRLHRPDDFRDLGPLRPPATAASATSTCSPASGAWRFRPRPSGPEHRVPPPPGRRQAVRGERGLGSG